MAKTIHALVTERLTTASPCSSWPASASARMQRQDLSDNHGIDCVRLLILAHEELSLAVRMLVDSGLNNAAARWRDARFSPTLCCAWPLFLTIVLSVIAWGAECYITRLPGLGYDDVSLEVCVFLRLRHGRRRRHAGGLGVADGVLAGGAATLEGISQPVGVTAAMLIQVCTSG